MWLRGRNCSNCALAGKPSGPVGLDSLDIHGRREGCGKLEGCAIMLGELGEKEGRRWVVGGRGGLMRQEGLRIFLFFALIHPILVQQGHGILLCLMSKNKSTNFG